MRRIADRDRPKQFCRILGKSTILERTFDRIALSFPAERILTVVTRAHARFYDTELPEAMFPGLVVQPRNRGTAPAILYALVRAQKMDSNAAVAIFPSDHFVNDDAAFMRHVDLAFEAIKVRPDLLVLLGITPDGPEVDYCWMQMGDRVAEYLSLFQIRSYWERPPRPLALRLWQMGCLWNSSVLVGQTAVLRSLMRGAFPQLFASFGELSARIDSGDGGEAADAIYETIAEQDVFHEIAWGLVKNLAVLPVAGVDWNDLGKPRRAIAALRRAGIRSE